MEKWGMFEFNTPYVGEIIEKINDVVLPNDYIEFMKRHLFKSINDDERLGIARIRIVLAKNGERKERRTAKVS